LNISFKIKLLQDLRDILLKNGSLSDENVNVSYVMTPNIHIDSEVFIQRHFWDERVTYLN